MQNPDFTIENSVLQAYCGTDVHVVIPDTVSMIGNGAFFHCETLTSITIPDSVTQIGKGAFHGCANLTEILIPRCVTGIDAGAFSFCGSLRSISVDPLNPSFCADADGVLYDKKKTKLIRYPEGNEQTTFAIPEGIRTIDRAAFLSCKHLRSVLIPDSVQEIGEGAFRFCTDIVSVVIPEGVTVIDDCTFEACTNLTEITIPRSVTSIGAYALSGCMRLRTIFYSGSKEDCEKIRVSASNKTLPFANWFCTAQHCRNV